METTDIVIHKGEKEEKYRLYVEDYVMSYLKKYGTADGRKIFFYGTKEQKNKKYYIYGAGRQKNISYFVRYELLDEIMCRYDMDTPVFSIKEDSGRYNLAGYYIFYQSNEAMQSYMIEQRKEAESEEKERDKPKARPRGKAQPWTKGQLGMAQPRAKEQLGMGRSWSKEQPGAQSRAKEQPDKAQSNMMQSKSRPQDFSDIRMRSGLGRAEGAQRRGTATETGRLQTNVRRGGKSPSENKGGIMAFQLSALFLVLSAIIVNSTNSYSKLKELGQSAVEVFFAMENQDASGRSENGKDKHTADVTIMGDGETAGTSDSDGDMVKSSGQEGETEKNSLEQDGAAAQNPLMPYSGNTQNSLGQDGAQQSKGTILRLEDLDAEFEKENKAAKDSGNEGNEGNENQDTAAKEETKEEDVSEKTGENDSGNEGDGKKNTAAKDSGNEGNENKNTAANDSGNEGNENKETSPSKEAFARNFAEYYQIEKGDTLCNISIKVYGDASKVKDICEINKIEDPDNIKYGQKILLP